MNSLKILIADDSKEVRELLHDLFVAGGHEVIDAVNGEEAIKVFDSHQPDIVFLDIMMPRLSGMEVLPYIKKISPNTPVIVMTAHGSEEMAVEVMKLGADDYLSKPISYKDLLSLVENLVEKKRIKLENIRLKEKIHNTEKYLAHLIDNVDDAIISCDTDGRILSFNRAAESLWQFEEDEVLNKPLASLFKNGTGNNYVEKVLHITKDEKKYCGEFIFIKKNGTEFSGSLATSLINDDSANKSGIVSVIRDLTIEKQLSKQLIKSAKLASLGKVVEGIAHEVRNPLVSMGGLAKRMEKTVDKDSSDSHYLKMIIDDVNRLETMVNDIEAYVHFAKRHKAPFHPVQLAEIIPQSLSSLALKEKNIETEIFRQPLPDIYGDEKALKNLFHNIFENSMEAMPGGGRLNVDYTLDDNYINVMISDTGCGIPVEKVEDIYNPFYTSKMSGIGIGLAKSYIIVEEHFGFINVESEEGEGTTFTLTFPVERRQLVRA